MNATAEVADKLRAIAQELREYPEHWARNHFAVTACGNSVGATESTACRWCAIGFIRRDFDSELRRGGMHRVINSPAYLALMDALNERGALDEENGIPEWNDAPGRTALEVADAFDRAAELVQS
jgi:hypothetical protein